MLSLLGASLVLCPHLRPPAIRSIPYRALERCAAGQNDESRISITYHSVSLIPPKEYCCEKKGRKESNLPPPVPESYSLFIQGNGTQGVRFDVLEGQLKRASVITTMLCSSQYNL